MITLNIENVRSALDAEIAHARDGLSFYTSRVDMLTALLRQVEALQPGMPDTIPKISQEDGIRVPKARKKRRAPDVGNRHASDFTGQPSPRSSLPPTPIEFWRPLFDATPVDRNQLLQRAVRTIRVPLSEGDIGRLRMRMANVIHSMVKDGTIESTGQGRQRMFSRRS